MVEKKNLREIQIHNKQMNLWMYMNCVEADRKSHQFRKATFKG